MNKEQATIAVSTVLSTAGVIYIPGIGWILYSKTEGEA